MKEQKNIKKYICMFFIFISIILGLQINSKAAEVQNFNIKLTTQREPKTLEVGDKFDIDINVKSEESINTVVGYLNFNKEILKVATNEEGEYCIKSNNGWICLTYFEDDGEFSVFRYGLDKTDESVATITFEVIKETKSTEIRFNDAYACRGALTFDALENALIVIDDKPATDGLITYSFKQGISGSMQSTQGFTKGEETTITTEIPNRDGYRFVGWSSSEGSTDIAYRPGDKFKSDVDVTLYAVWENAQNMNAMLISNVKKLNPGDTVILGISVDISEINLSEFTCNLEYDKNIFEDITENDIVGINKWDDPVFNTENNKISAQKTDEVTNSGTICLIKMKVKEGIEVGETKVSIKDIEGKNEEIYYVAKDTDIIFNATQNDPEPQDEELSLESDEYVIGEDEKYSEGDQYILKIPASTQLSQFINNCRTNGVISVYNLNGEPLSFTEYVGTGMKIKVTKGEKEIELTLVVVQDLDGDGMVTVSDLSLEVAYLTGDTQLTELQKMAGDIDNDKEVSVSDLSSIIEKLSVQ